MNNYVQECFQNKQKKNRVQKNKILTTNSYPQPVEKKEKKMLKLVKKISHKLQLDF